MRIQPYACMHQRANRYSWHILDNVGWYRQLAGVDCATCARELSGSPAAASKQRSERRPYQYILDYGSLIHITLQRAATAREAIATIAALTAECGYATEMEGFSIADGEEVWSGENPIFSIVADR